MSRKYTKWSEELLTPVVANSRSIAEVLTKLGLKPTGGNYSNLKKNILKFGLDTSHFTGQAWCKGIFKPLDSLKGREAIKKNILRDFGAKCSVCGICDWNGKPLTLELDHINGDNLDNRRENLRILCPNCHSQTPTFRNQKR